MPLPAPEPGLVISYSYLWRREHRGGQEEGRKNRPAVIVLAVADGKGGKRVTVAPITHAPPGKGGEAIELPARVKQALGLDDERSWIVLDEVNQFTWPGFDLRPAPGAKDRFAYGFIPPKLYDAVIARILALVAERRVAQVPRD